MKKIIQYLLLGSLLLSAVAPVSAQDKDKHKEKKEKHKDKHKEHKDKKKEDKQKHKDKD